MTSEGPVSNSNSKEAKRQKDWIRKCVSNFSLYADLVGNRVDDPQEQLEAMRSGDFKPKLTKASKKRLRRTRKTKKTKFETTDIFKPKKLEALDRYYKLRKTKKDMQKVINKLSKMPL